MEESPLPLLLIFLASLATMHGGFDGVCEVFLSIRGNDIHSCRREEHMEESPFPLLLIFLAPLATKHGGFIVVREVFPLIRGSLAGERKIECLEIKDYCATCIQTVRSSNNFPRRIPLSDFPHTSSCTYTMVALLV